MVHAKQREGDLKELDEFEDGGIEERKVL